MRHLTCSASPSSSVQFSWESVFGELSCTGYKQIHMALVRRSRKPSEDLKMPRNGEGGAWKIHPEIATVCWWYGGVGAGVDFTASAPFLAYHGVIELLDDDITTRQTFHSHYITALRERKDKKGTLLCFYC